jgi:hypothetical protein
MRRVACLLALSALSAQAEAGPPTAAEIAGADAACAVEVMQDCLLMIATGIALANPDISESALNDIAFAQASPGDTEGAERTLSLTTPGFLALSALGRVDEATAAFKA